VNWISWHKVVFVYRIYIRLWTQVWCNIVIWHGHYLYFIGTPSSHRQDHNNISYSTFYSINLQLNTIDIVLNVNLKNNFREEFIRHRPHRKRRVQQFFYCCVCIRCRGKVSTEPSNDRRDTHTDKGWWEGFMKYAVEMGPGAMILSRVRRLI
jgi:hypothetical protein